MTPIPDTLRAALDLAEQRILDSLNGTDKRGYVASELYRLRAALQGDADAPVGGLRHEQSGMTETAFSPWYSGRCVTPLPGCWAGDGSENEGRVTEAACAHTLETGHETSVTRESSHHYRLAALQGDADAPVGGLRHEQSGTPQRRDPPPLEKER